MLLPLVCYGGGLWQASLWSGTWRVATLFDTPPLYRGGTGRKVETSGTHRHLSHTRCQYHTSGTGSDGVLRFSTSSRKSFPAIIPYSRSFCSTVLRASSGWLFSSERCASHTCLSDGVAFSAKAIAQSVFERCPLSLAMRRFRCSG